MTSKEDMGRGRSPKKAADPVVWVALLTCVFILWYSCIPLFRTPDLATTSTFTFTVCKMLPVDAVAIPAGLPPIPSQPSVSSAAAWLKSEGARYGPTISEIPETLLPRFTLNGAVPVIKHVFNQPYLGGTALESVWTYDMVEKLKKQAAARKPRFSYDNAPVYEVLDRWAAAAVAGKRGLVVGSEVPWAEATLLSYGAAHVTTLEFGRIDSRHPALDSWTPQNFTAAFLEGKIEPFDFAFTYSSLEHDGLGRYGDLLNPEGDLLSMARLRDVVNPGGVVFFGAPCCWDALEWNAHRVYGPKRLPLLFAGWRELGAYAGEGEAVPEVGRRLGLYRQPMWALQNMKGCGTGETVARPRLLTT